MNLLYDGVVDGGVLDDLHVLLAVEEQRIVALAHKEMLYLPVVLLHHLDLAILLRGQGEMNALHLQLAVDDEVVDEIVEQLVSSLGHGIVFYQRL